jgi:hypothetical protein
MKVPMSVLADFVVAKGEVERALHRPTSACRVVLRGTMSNEKVPEILDPEMLDTVTDPDPPLPGIPASQLTLAGSLPLAALG